MNTSLYAGRSDLRWSSKLHNFLRQHKCISLFWYCTLVILHPAIAQTPPKPAVISPGVTSVIGDIVVGPSITFKWNAVSSATRYEIYWRIDPPSGQLFETSIIAPTTTYTTSLLVGSYYRWNMKAFNGALSSPISDTLYFYVTANPPSNLSPGAASEGQAPRLTTLTPTLSFSAVPNVNAYVVYISKKPYGSANLVDTGFVTTGTSYTVPNGVLALGTYYRWDVTSCPGDIEGPPSANSYFKTPGPPDSPYGLAAVGAIDFVSLAWEDGSDNESGFVIQRQIVGITSWDNVGRTDANILAHRDFTALPGVAYNYRVVAENQYGSSAPSGQVQAARIALPNLVPSSVPGGNSPIVLSRTPGSLTDDASFGLDVDLYAAVAVANIGAAATSSGFIIQVALNETLLTNVTSAALTAGAVVYQKDILIPKSRLQVGQNYIAITADNSAVITETDETDNTFIKSFTVLAVPAITVLNPNNGYPLHCNRSYQISWTISGDTSAIAAYRLSYSLDAGGSFNDAGISVAAPATLITWSLPDSSTFTTSTGRLKIRALNSQGGEVASGTTTADLVITPPVDGPTAVPETDNYAPQSEQPVFFSAKKSMPAAPDLPITSFTWSCPNLFYSDQKDFSFAFPTPLSGSASYPVSLTVTASDGRFDTKTIYVTVTGRALGPFSGSSTSPDPVNLATGNYMYQHTDLRIPGEGFPFEFSRFYNSKGITGDGKPMGFGWTHSYNIYLATTLTNATVFFGDGRSEVYGLNGDTYQAESGVYNSLVGNAGGTFTLTTKEQFRFNFDPQGHLASLVDKNGNTLSLNYSGANLDSIIDTAARTIQFQSDSNGRLTSMTDSLGRTIRWEYDARGDLIHAIDANDGTNSYAYDSYHQLTDGFDPRRNRYVHNDYDEFLRVVSTQADALGGQSGFTYDFLTRTTFVTNALNSVSIHRHDTNLLVTNIIDELGNSEFFEYDSSRNRIKVTDRNGNVTRYAYDDRGNVTVKIDALGNSTSIQYDANNNPTFHIDALGNQAAYGYDDRGNLTSATNALLFVNAIAYTNGGLPSILTDANGHSTTNVWDEYGNLLMTEDALAFTNRYFYDAAGRKTAQVDPNNHTNRFYYDNNDNLTNLVDGLGFTNQYFYDANNNRTITTNPRSVGTTNIYDAKDRLVKVISALGKSSTHIYDALDRKIESFDSLGNPTQYGYDAIGNLLTITNATGYVTAFTYDNNQNQLTVSNALGHISTNYYDKLNRLIGTVNNLGHSTTNIYDELGRLIFATNANGQVTEFKYDAISRLTNVIDAAGGQIFYSYDAVGNRLTVTDPKGNTWRYLYDELNRLVEEKDPLGNTQRFTYDGAGNVTSKVKADGIVIGYLYDADNHLTNVSYPNGPPVLFRYDAAGNRTNMVDGIGTTSWEYNLLNRLISVTDPFGKTVAYGYDENDNRTFITYPENKTVTYRYDLLNRLLTVTDWLSGVTSYSYDAVGNLTTTTNANGTTVAYGYDGASRLIGMTNCYSSGQSIESYTYGLDALGNPTNSIETELLVPIIANSTTSYGYNGANQLTSVNDDSVTHDNNGNLITWGEDVFSYDVEDRLTNMVTVGVTGVFRYDGLGNRLSYTSNGIERRFVLDRAGALTQVLAETDDSGNVIAYYVYGLGLISQIKPDNTFKQYHFDIRGSTIALTQSGTTTTDSYSYDHFGILSNSDGTNANRFHYLGRYGIIDDGNGLLYARARYFSPDLGRFLTLDPITGKDSDSQSLNRYVYALNNPIRYTDVSGLSYQEGHIGSYNPYAAEAAYWEAYNDSVSWMIPYLKALELAGFVAAIALDLGPIVIEIRAAASTAYLANSSAGLSHIGNSTLRGTVSENISAAKEVQSMFHYTNQKGFIGILESGNLRPSLRAVNPNDVRYGNGQYLSDIVPGTKTPAQLSREFLGQPFQGSKYTHYIEIDVSGLNIIQGRPGVFVIPNEASLNLGERIIKSGPLP